MVVGNTRCILTAVCSLVFAPKNYSPQLGLRPVNDPLIARFADACGATGPLDLRVDLAGGSVLAEGSVDQPFTLVGRDDACDVTLSDPEVNMRHAWLQVLGGRVFVADLGSRTGLSWANGGRGPGWLDVGVPVQIGPFLLHLRSPTSERPSSYPTGYNPLTADNGVKTRPVVSLEFRNGRRAKDRWTVNRLLTLIGRASDCKIHLNADDISPYHCGLVSTRTGLWVVDLSGRGVVVNGERMRVSPLAQNAELWVGRFLIGCHYQTPPSPPTTSSAARPTLPPPPVAGAGGRLTSPASPNRAPLPGQQSPPGDARITTTPAPIPIPVTSPPPPLSPEDEVELGAAPDTEGLPASHIMADVFHEREANPGESMSNPILVSGSGPKPPVALPPGSPLAGLLDELATATTNSAYFSPLLRQMADLHGRTVAEFQQWLNLLTQLFNRVKREHLTVVQHELNRIQELTAEITAIQAEVARQTLEQAATDRARQFTSSTPPAEPAESHSGSWVPPSTKTPLPDHPLTTPPSSVTRSAEKLASLQQDRAARWQALLVLFAGM